MNPATHALTMNGRINGELKDPDDSPEGVIRKRLSSLDGRRRFSLMLWALPHGVAFDDVDIVNGPDEYIQTAGSRERMTIEIRRIEANGPRQYVVGRSLPSRDDDEPAAELIEWDGGIQTIVHPSEVFCAHEAAELFVSYYATGWIPESYALRLLDV